MLNEMGKRFHAQIVHRVNSEMDLLKSRINGIFSGVEAPADIKNSKDPLAMFDWTMTKVAQLVAASIEEDNQLFLERASLDDGK